MVEVRHDLRLDLPLLEQYGIYLLNILHGDFGNSRRTSQSVMTDVSQRLPATLELITLAGLVSVLLGIPIGVWTAVRRKGIVDRFLLGYGMLAGSVPGFWLGLILIFVFFSLLGWVPGPIGQLDPVVDAPPRITGMIALDALLSGQWETLQSAVAHLVLPVATLTIVYMALIIKNVRSTMQEMMKSEFVQYARALGLSPFMQVRYALRNSMTAMVTVISIMFWFMLGGAVLVETVFS
jgi:ABC-type dipeptide/oligopeptide/nickel transport system permease component